MRLFRWLLTFTLLALPVVSEAAIAFVSVTNAAAAVSVDSVTTTVTVPSGTDRVMLACAATEGNTGVPVTGVTFNTTETFTKIRHDQRNAGGGVEIITNLWYLVNPTVTTADAVTTFSTAQNDRAIGISYAIFNGVSQSSPIDAQAGGTGSSGTLSAVLTTVAANAWIADCAAGDNDLTVGAGQTMRVDRAILVQLFVGVSTVDGKATPGSETMDWTQTTEDWATSAVSFAPSGGSDPPTSSPLQATLQWTNGTDPPGGTGVTGAGIRRSTGAGSTPLTILTTRSASNGTAGLFVDNSLATNTTYCYSVNNFDGAGNQSSFFTPPVCITSGTTFRTVLATKTFDIANTTDIGSDFDAGYIGRTNAQIVSNRVRSVTLGTGSTETYNGVSTPADQWMQWTAPTLTGGIFAASGGLVRFANAPTMSGYACAIEINPTAFVINEWTTGTAVALGTPNTTATNIAGDKYRCEAQGTTLRFYQVRGTVETLLTSATDASFATGKTGLNVRVSAGGSLASAEFDDFLMGGFDTVPPVAPTIDNVIIDPAGTGADVTWNLTTPPTQIRVDAGNGSGTFLNVIKPISDFPAGRFTFTWPDGYTFAGFHALNNVGIETTTPASAYQYRSLVGIVDPEDTTPVVLSNPVPTTDLPFGTTSTTISVSIDKVASCRYDTTDIAYASMANQMSVSGLSASATVGSLTNGSTTILYVRCLFISDPSLAEYPNLTSQVITVHVLSGAGADTTAPTTVTDLSCTASTLGCVWSPATDAGGIQGYQVHGSTDACVTPLFTLFVVPASATLTNLFPNTLYCIQVKAIDTSNNLSAAFSTSYSFTTASVPDVEPPSQMTNLQANCGFTAACVLTWDTGIDAQGAVTSSIERCQVVSGDTCSNFGSTVSLIASTHLSGDLTANTRWCFRGRLSDGTNAGAYSDVVCGTTNTTGLPRPRLEVPFSFPRTDAGARLPSGTRLPRP
jgi:hypothetical protein